MPISLASFVPFHIKFIRYKNFQKMKFKLFLRWCCQDSNEVESDSQLPRVMQLETNSNVSHSRFSHHFEQGVSGVQGTVDESNLSLYMTPLTEKEISEYPKIKITVVDSTVIEPGTALHINAAGMINSRRNKSDLCTYIGAAEMDGDEVINDFVVDELDKGMGKKHLVIKFIPNKGKYFISDLGEGTGTFVRIDAPLVLRDSYIISFGDSHMATQFVPNMPNKISLKFLEGPKQNEVITFTDAEGKILIGRMVDCRIRFEDNSMSRYQCNIQYFPDRGWALEDGDGNKKSTNGTWLFVEEDFEIYNAMVFKAGKSLFEITFE
ncbi:unnamed protein product [Blepharisma stoltei]|uniref:FHA domain-containing protein n=1 Tax=Blepharisma stoltei TaxID=1481888 RepID=A0AAU9JFN8_9CILI|nr:unnamed protein product [Blepharisma stoltei]